MLHRPPTGRRTTRRGPIPSTLAPRSDTLRRKRGAGGDDQASEVDDTAGYDASVWFEHANAYAFFDEDGGKATAEHPAARPGRRADLDDDEDDSDDPWESWGGVGDDAWGAAEFDAHGGSADEHPPTEPEAFQAEARSADGTASVEDTAPMGSRASAGAASGRGPAPTKFVFLAAATRYALDYMPHDEVTDWAPEAPPVMDDVDTDAVEETDDDVDLLADDVEEAVDGDEEVPGPARPPAPATHHGGRGRKGRRLHAQRRADRPATKRRAAIAAVVLTGGIAGTAVALSGSGGGERVATQTPTTDGFRDDLLTTPSTFYALADLPDPGLTDTTSPVTAPVTVAPTTTSTTRATRPTAATTAPPAATTTLVPVTTMPPFTTTTLVTTTTTRAPTTTTTAVTTTTTAPTTTTTTQPTTTSTTEAP